MKGEHLAEPLIRFESVCLDLGGRRILDRLSLDVPEGRFVCIIGPSGCGKTTLLRLVGGLAAPASGQVLYRGAPVAGPSSELAMVFQDYGRALLPWRDAAGNVALALEAMDVPKSQRRERIDELLTRVGLAAHAAKYPHELSGGMQQRLQIARALAQRPRVLLMDEPFGALDAMTRESLQVEVARWVEQEHTTVLFVTHDLDEALYLGDVVIALQANPGQVAAVVDVPLARPRDALAARESALFLSLRHRLHGLVHAGMP